MNSAAPSPNDKETQVDEEIDEAIARIDACLPEIHRRAAVKNGKSGRARGTKRSAKSQTIFRAMAGDSLLTDSDDDVKVKAPPKNKS